MNKTPRYMKEYTMFKWSEVIEAHWEDLKEALQKAFCNAVDYQAMEFSVELFPDGKIRQNEQAAGSNFQSFSSWNGESIIIGVFCFQNAEIDITEEMYREYMTEEEQRTVEEEAKDEGISFLLDKWKMLPPVKRLNGDSEWTLCL